MAYARGRAVRRTHRARIGRWECSYWGCILSKALPQSYTARPTQRQQCRSTSRRLDYDSRPAGRYGDTGQVVRGASRHKWSRQSMFVLPAYVRRQLVRLWQEHRRPRCRGRVPTGDVARWELHPDGVQRGQNRVSFAGSKLRMANYSRS
jgi:hypothetical protein